MPFKCQIIFEPLRARDALFLLVVSVQGLQVPVGVPLDGEGFLTKDAHPTVAVVPGQKLIQVRGS